MELYKGKHFQIVFSLDQSFPGCCIISGNKEHLSDMTQEEWIELGKLEKKLEEACKKVLNPTMFNFACLMNNAYRDNEKPHVHFWFIPRYREERVILSKKYKDKHFGYNFWKWDKNKLKSQKDIFTKEEKTILYEMLKKEFK